MLRPSFLKGLLKRFINPYFLKSASVSLTANKKMMSELPVLKSNKVALVACGSFNPITFMHLRMFELAKDYFTEHYPNVIVNKGILSPVSDCYGKPGLVAGSHRKKMCQLAIGDDSWVKVGTWELEQSEWMPTVEVLKHYEGDVVEKEIAEKAMLLCGADILHSFSIKGLWLESDIRNIIQHHGIVVITRPSHNVNDVIGASKLLSELRSQIHVISEHFTNATSATSIRLAIREKKSVKFLIPDSVIDYIKANVLYSGSPTNSTGELAPIIKYKNKH